jgi:hypothetical protein
MATLQQAEAVTPHCARLGPSSRVAVFRFISVSVAPAKLPKLNMPHYNSSEAIILEFQPPFAILTLNQPQKKNALSLELYKRLSTLLQVSRNLICTGHSGARLCMYATRKACLALRPRSVPDRLAGWLIEPGHTSLTRSRLVNRPP